MAVQRTRQDRIWSEGANINDALSPADHDANAVTIKDSIDFVCSQLADMLGEASWTNAPDLSIAAMAAKKWLDDFLGIRDYLHLGADVSVPASQNWVVLSASGSETPSRVIAINSTTKGAVSAQLGVGDFGSHQLDEVAGANALNPDNLVMVMDGTTGDPIKSSGRQVYALLQVEDTASDNTAFDDSSNQGQLSFVRPNATYTDLEACPVADIESQSILYAYADREQLSLWASSDFRRSSVLVDLAAAGVSVTLDIAYDGGSQVAVDNTDVDWRLTDTKHFYISDASGATRILDVHAEVAGDEIDINAPGGIAIAAGDISAPSNKATFNGTEIGGAAGRVAATATDLDLRGADDITFVTVRETTPLPLDDATAGPISALEGGPHASVSAAIQYAIDHGMDFNLGVFQVSAGPYTQGTNIPAATGGVSIASPHSIDMNTPGGVDTFIFLNGRLQWGGNATTKNDVYAGDVPGNGDLKFDHTGPILNGDVIITLQLSAA